MRNVLRLVFKSRLSYFDTACIIAILASGWPWWVIMPLVIILAIISLTVESALT